MKTRVLTFAVDGHGSLCALTDVQETACDDVTGCAAIHKEEVIVVEPSVSETLGIIDLLVQTDDAGHVVFPEVWEVSLRSMERVTCRVVGSTKGVNAGSHYFFSLLRSNCCPWDSPFSIVVLGWGPLKARSFPGTIQFRSPFSTRCRFKSPKKTEHKTCECYSQDRTERCQKPTAQCWSSM